MPLFVETASCNFPGSHKKPQFARLWWRINIKVKCACRPQPSETGATCLSTGPYLSTGRTCPQAEAVTRPFALSAHALNEVTETAC